jgi:hypothetical protein
MLVLVVMAMIMAAVLVVNVNGNGVLGCFYVSSGRVDNLGCGGGVSHQDTVSARQLGRE